MMMWLSNEDEVLQDCKEDQREVMVVWRFPLCFSRKIGSNDESFYIPAVFLCGMQIMDTCLMTCQIIGIIVLMGQESTVELLQILPPAHHQPSTFVVVTMVIILIFSLSNQIHTSSRGNLPIFNNTPLVDLVNTSV